MYKFYGWLLGDFSYGFAAGKEAKQFVCASKFSKLDVFFWDCYSFCRQLSLEGVFNSIYWLNDFGVLEDIYHKRALVPFGEYLPMYKFYYFEYLIFLVCELFLLAQRFWF